MTCVEYLSIEEVAQRLQLHVRTVRRYVRGGRLKSVRVGKQYRIAPEDLAAFVTPGAAALSSERVARRRHVEITGVLAIDVISAEEADRLGSAIKATARGWHRGYRPLEVQSLYDLNRAHLKLILTGDLPGIGDLLDLVQLLAGP